MKSCMRKLAPVFNTNRMVQRVRREVLHPRARRAARCSPRDSMARSRRSWRTRRTRSASKWGGIKVVGVHTSGNGHYKVGDRDAGRSDARPAGPRPEGRARPALRRPDQRDRARSSARRSLDDDTTCKQMAPGRHVFTGTIECRTSGRQGFAMRVLPGQAGHGDAV